MRRKKKRLLVGQDTKCKCFFWTKFGVVFSEVNNHHENEDPLFAGRDMRMTGSEEEEAREEEEEVPQGKKGAGKEEDDSDMVGKRERHFLIDKKKKKKKASLP